MATKTCPTTTITTTSSTKAVVSCFAYEGKQDDSQHPAILRASIISQAEEEIDGVKGKEGELIITSVNEQNNGVLDSDGNLIITTSDDDAKNYSIEDLDLIYNG